MYLHDQFYRDFTTSLGNQAKMSAVGRLCNLLGIKPGVDTDLHIYRPWSWGSPVKHRVTLEVDVKRLSHANRNRLKRHVKLAVPEYALGGTYKEPPLMGVIVVRHNMVCDTTALPENMNAEDYGLDVIEIDVQVNGAYVCEKVGDQEKEPSEWECKQAGKLAAMTDEEILAKHRNEVLDMLKPKLVASYECRSAIGGE